MVLGEACVYSARGDGFESIRCHEEGRGEGPEPTWRSHKVGKAETRRDHSCRDVVRDGRR